MSTTIAKLVRSVRNKEKSGSYPVLKNTQLQIMQEYDFRIASRWFPFINPRISAPVGTDLRVWAVPHGNYRVVEERPERSNANSRPPDKQSSCNSINETNIEILTDDFSESTSVLLSRCYERVVSSGHGAYVAMAIRDSLDMCRRLIPERNRDVVALTHGFLQLRDPLANVVIYYCGSETIFRCALAKWSKLLLSEAPTGTTIDETMSKKPTNDTDQCIDPVSTEPKVEAIGCASTVSNLPCVDDDTSKDLAEQATEIDNVADDSDVVTSDDDSDDSDDSIAGEKPSTQKKKHAAHDIPSILDLFGIKTANQAVIVPPDASKPLAAVLRSLHVWSKDKQLSTRHGLHRIADRAADDPNATNDPGAAKHEETRRSKRSSGELDAPTSKKVAVCSSSDDHPKYSGKKLSVVFHDFECVYVLCKFSRLTKVSDKVENTPAIVVEHF